MIKILLAQKPYQLGIIKGLGPLGEGGRFAWDIGQAVGVFSQVISNIVGFMTIIAGIWFIFSFIIGAFGWLTAGGDKAKVEAAQKKITTAIIGLAVVIAATFLIDLIGNLLGLDILSPGEFILSFWP